MRHGRSAAGRSRPDGLHTGGAHGCGCQARTSRRSPGCHAVCCAPTMCRQCAVGRRAALDHPERV
eukprot:3942813-Prymnesium_polylepis.1